MGGNPPNKIKVHETPNLAVIFTWEESAGGFTGNGVPLAAEVGMKEPFREK